MRVALAATLFAEPDLLLLDEPTNYLDLEGTLWLEDHLAHYPRTVIVISHDRDLLDTSVDQILHLDRGKLTLYSGSYSSFEEQRATREMLDAKHVKRQEDERKRLQAFVDRFKAKASKARQAQSRVKMLERMQPIAALVTQDVREIIVPDAGEAAVAADHRGRRRLGRLRARQSRCSTASRCASTMTTASRCSAQNGNGKSTLVKLLAGQAARRSPAGSRAPTSSRSAISRSTSSTNSNLDGSPYDACPQADARCAGERRCARAPARSAFPARPATPR